MWVLVTQRRRGDQGAAQPAGALGSPSVQGCICREEGTGARLGLTTGAGGQWGESG